MRMRVGRVDLLHFDSVPDKFTFFCLFPVRSIGSTTSDWSSFKLFAHLKIIYLSLRVLEREAANQNLTKWHFGQNATDGKPSMTFCNANILRI